MTTAEAAERLNMTKRSVARLCDAGTIKAVKHGRDYWIEETEIDRFQAARKPAGRPRKGPTA